MDHPDQKWHPRYYPDLPERMGTLENTMHSVEEKLSRGEKIMGRLQWMGWVIALELLVMLAQRWI